MNSQWINFQFSLSVRAACGNKYSQLSLLSRIRTLRHDGYDSRKRLSAEAVEGLALALERVHDIHSRDGLAASVLGVGNRVTDHVLEEHLEYATGLLVDEARDALYATTACKTANSRLGDALDVIPEHLAVALSAALAKTFASFSATRHCCKLGW